MTRALVVIWLCSFTSALVSRLTDPVLPQIAIDLGVEVRATALLSTAFALPWALSQPILGPLGDLLGKVRVILVGLVVLAAASFAGAFAPNFGLLFASRVVCGISAAAVSPVAFALAADLLSPADRQIGIGRVLAASIFGGLLGAVGAGLLGDWIGWRGVLMVGGGAVVIAALVAPFGFRGVVEMPSAATGLRSAFGNYRIIFANPRAKICYGAVFLEGITIHGLMPYIAPLLAANGQRRATIAGLVIAGFALGGATYALSVRRLVNRFRQRTLMIAGGSFAALSLVLVGLEPAWPVQALALAGMGFGFFMLHNGIQIHMLELAPHARGSAVGMHAFSLFMGQAMGPVLYGLGIPTIGTLASTGLAAAIMVGVGVVCARRLPRAVPAVLKPPAA